MIGFYYGTSIPNEPKEGIYFIDNNNEYSIYAKRDDGDILKYGETNDSLRAEMNTKLETKANANMFFIGTHAEYLVAYKAGQIPVNAIVILTDDEDSSGGGSGGSGDSSNDPTSSLLGTGMLGYMILG